MSEVLDETQAPAESGEAGADLSPAADAAASSGADEGASSAPATEAAPAWNVDDPAFRTAVEDAADAMVQARLAPLMQQLEQGTPQQQQAAAEQIQELGDLNPFDDDFGQNLDARFAQMQQMMQEMVQQVQAPLQEQQQQAEAARLDGLVADLIADDVARNGDLSEKGVELLNAVGVQILPEFSQRYGQGSPRALEATIQKAGSIVREFAKMEREAGAEAYKNETATLAGVRGEPAAGLAGTSGSQTTPDVGSWDSFRAIDQRYASH